MKEQHYEKDREGGGLVIWQPILVETSMDDDDDDDDDEYKPAFLLQIFKLPP